MGLLFFCTFLRKNGHNIPAPPPFSRKQRKSHVVGYAQNDLDGNYGAVMIAAQFAGVGDEDASIPLKDLVPASASSAWAVQVSFILNDGSFDPDHNYMWDGSQWLYVDKEYAPVPETETIPAGQGLYVYNGAGEVFGLRSAGQVSDKDVTFPMDENYGAVGAGNSFPVEVALSDIVPTDVTSAAWQVQVSFILNDGSFDPDHNYMWDGSQWLYVDKEYAPVPATEKVPAGQGLYVYNGSGTANGLYIPAPEL